MTQTKSITWFLVALSFLSLPACGFKKLATKASTQIFYDATPAIDREEDVELASQSSLAFLKMLEGFYLQNPRDPQVLLLLTRSYAGYAYGFTENDILANKGGDAQAYEKAVSRAKLFYTRAKDFGIKLLSLDSGFAKANEGSLDQFQAAVKKFGKADLEKVFWATFAWGNYVNFNKDSVEAVAELPRIEALAQRLLEIDDGYYYGNAHLLLGAIYAGRPKMLGGDPDKAKDQFEKAIAVSQGKYLMAPVTEAQFYAVQVQDSGLYRKLLGEVLAADAAALPEQRLSNELAKIRAKILLEKQALFFNQGTPEKKSRQK